MMKTKGVASVPTTEASSLGGAVSSAASILSMGPEESVKIRDAEVSMPAFGAPSVILGPVKSIRGQVKAVADTELSLKSAGNRFVISGYASRPVVDRFNEVVEVGAFRTTLERYKKNPIILFMHDIRQPIGRATRLELRNDGLFVTAELASGYDPADKARKMVEQGVLRAFSIGFREKKGENDESGIHHIHDLELFEISLVSVPANQEALFTMDNEGKLCGVTLLEPDELPDEKLLAMAEERGLVASHKGVLRYRKFPTQSPETPWDAGAAKRALRKFATGPGGKIDFGKYALGFAYVIDGREDRLTGYKLPHHTVVGGQVKTNLRGCRAVIGVLAGARGGVQIPESARRGVYNHVARHIKSDFGADVPDFSELGKMLDELPQDASLEENVAKLFGITAEELASAWNEFTQGSEDAPSELGNAESSPEGKGASRAGQTTEEQPLPEGGGKADAGLGKELAERLHGLEAEVKSLHTRVQDIEQCLVTVLSDEVERLAAEERRLLAASDKSPASDGAGS